LELAESIERGRVRILEEVLKEEIDEEIVISKKDK
jgi:hypothetical protein